MLKVIIAHRNRAFLESFGRALANRDFEVFAVNSGGAALRLANRLEAAAVVSGVDLPDMGGFMLLDELKESNIHLPVVMLDSRNDEHHQSIVRQYNQSYYELQSAAPDYLVERVSQIVRSTLS